VIVLEQLISLACLISVLNAGRWRVHGLEQPQAPPISIMTD